MLSSMRPWMVLLLLVTACGDGEPGDDAGSPGADAGVTKDGGAAGTGVGVDPGDLAGPCDLTGAWALQRVSFGKADTILAPGAQKNTTWEYVEMTQHGDDITTDLGIWCGSITTGDAVVTFSDETVRAIQRRLTNTGRKGTSRMGESGCELAMERIYTAVGVVQDGTYLGGTSEPPGIVEGNPALDELTDLPMDPEDPGIEDWDEDGNPGVRYVITDSPVGSGVRHGLQRDWHEYVGPMDGDNSDFLVPVVVDFQEAVFNADPPLFGTTASPRPNTPATTRFLRVGPGTVGDDDLETCKNVQQLVPHRPDPRDAF